MGNNFRYKSTASEMLLKESTSERLEDWQRRAVKLTQSGQRASCGRCGQSGNGEPGHSVLYGLESRTNRSH